MQNYVDLLRDELKDAKKRYNAAGKEGRPVIKHQIRQIEQDIRRNSKAERANSI